MAEIEVPPYFLCPISLEIMKDPVTVSTGITYDRDSIEKWLFSLKNTTCPSTKQSLHNLDLTPNITLRRLIQSWCTLHAAAGIERLPTPKPPATKSHILKLLNDASNSPLTQSNSLQTLKSIASQNQTNKRCMETAGAAKFLAPLLVKIALELSRARDHQSQDHLSDLNKTCDDALSILHNLQLSESTLKSLTTNDEFLDSLTLIMQSGSYESRAYAIMLIKSMMEVADPSLYTSLKPEFFSELAQILNDQISQKATKATLKILITTSSWGRNRIKVVENGVVSILIDMLLDSSTSEKRVSEMILIALDILCQCAEGRAELLKHGGGLAVVSKKILRVSAAASERAVRILHSVSRFSANHGVLVEMLQIGVVAKLCLVIQVDCGPKTKERAKEILRLHARAWRNSSCIPNNLISSYPL